jgi:Cyclin, C-terminal domain/Cyclin, N-terminal domain
MNFLDRYLEVYFASGHKVGLPKINKRHFQLVTMCCLYLAMKLRGPHSRIPIAYMVQLSRGTVNEVEMIAMERELLGKLSWLVNPPTAFDFLKHYLQLLQPAAALNSQAVTSPPKSPRLTAVEDLASFLVELSVLDYYFVSVRPSTVALAALFNAMDEDPRLAAVMGNPFLQRTYYHGYEGLIVAGEEEALHMARQRLASLYNNAGGTSNDILTEPGSPTPSMNDGDDKGNARITSPVSVFFQQ